MKTYKLEDLIASQKSGIDYHYEHERMLTHLKEHTTEKDPPVIWALPDSSDPFWKVGNILERDGQYQEGSGRAPKLPTDE